MFLSCKNTSNTSKADNHEVLNRKADNATIKREKKTSNGDKTLHRKIKNQHEPHKKLGPISGAPVWQAVRAP
jgi:hypothetical protein